jgi:hypothetical protein
LPKGFALQLGKQIFEILKRSTILGNLLYIPWRGEKIDDDIIA